MTAPTKLYSPEEHRARGWHEPHETPEYLAWEKARDSFNVIEWAIDHMPDVADKLYNDYANQWRLLRLVEAFYNERRNCLMLASFNEACDDFKPHQIASAVADADIPNSRLIEFALKDSEGMTAAQFDACECIRDWVEINEDFFFDMSLGEA